jgi:hypothetical protein
MTFLRDLVLCSFNGVYQTRGSLGTDFHPFPSTVRRVLERGVGGKGWQSRTLVSGMTSPLFARTRLSEVS